MGKVPVPALPSHPASAQPVKPRHDPKCTTDYLIFIVGTGTVEMSWVSCNICVSHSLGCFPNGALSLALYSQRKVAFLT